MKFAILSLVVALAPEATPTILPKKAACATISQRKAWHMLTRDEKLAYINAEKCLMDKPAKLGLEGAKTLFDEFQKLHVQNTVHVHFVGAFLPFHRYLMHTHETVLRTECNYTGAQPYWQETLDAGNFTHSIVLDPEIGFGGDGAGPNNCVKDGPFKDYINSVGPLQQITDHCINRKIDECSSAQAAKKNVDQCLTAKSFTTMWPCLEGLPHAAGHGGIGGEMLDLFSSPGDPIFYLHHTYLDKLWWDWQSQNLTSRLTEIGGSNAGLNISFPGFPGGGIPPGGFPPGGFPPGNGTNGTIPGFPGGGIPCGAFPGPGFGTPPARAAAEGAVLVQSAGDPGNVTTLGHVLTVFGMLPNVTVGDVMDIQGGYLCYEYI